MSVRLPVMCKYRKQLRLTKVDMLNNFSKICFLLSRKDLTRMDTGLRAQNEKELST